MRGWKRQQEFKMSEETNEITPEQFVEVLKRRVKKDWDAVVGITGEEGSSKSTLASWFVYLGCLYDGLNEEDALKKFTDYTIFSPNKERVQEQITKSERYSIINADEAIKILYKQNWATPIQKFLNMFYALCRQENKVSILCMPRFLDFNEFFRNHRIKFWIHVVDRGVAVVFERDWFPSSADPWMLKESQKLNYMLYTKRKTGDFNTEQKIQALAKLKNFIGVIRFEDLPTKLKNVYRDGKAEFAYMDLEEQIKQGEVAPGARAKEYQQALIDTVHNLHKQGMLSKDIAKTMNLSGKTIGRYLQTKRLDENEYINNKHVEDDNYD
jgi:hypothetical protein